MSPPFNGHGFVRNHWRSLRAGLWIRQSITLSQIRSILGPKIPMNSFQELWWIQAKSDYEIFERLRSQGVAQCHLLHYLQMCTEKIAKAYYWREGSAAPMSHVGFVRFLTLLAQSRQRDNRERIATLFGYKRFNDFQSRVRMTTPLAYDLERLAPALAADGPNTEYPWPHQAPQQAPAAFDFPTWREFEKPNGRELMKIIKSAVLRFPEYAST